MSGHTPAPWRIAGRGLRQWIRELERRDREAYARTGGG